MKWQKDEKQVESCTNEGNNKLEKVEFYLLLSNKKTQNFFMGVSCLKVIRSSNSGQFKVASKEVVFYANILPVWYLVIGRVDTD